MPSRNDWALPLDIILHTAKALTPHETGSSTAVLQDYRLVTKTLRNLSATCKSIRSNLHNLQHRVILVDNSYQMAKHFIQLARNPQMRRFVRHIYWNTRAGYDDSLQSATDFWIEHYGPDICVDTILAGAGFKIRKFGRKAWRRAPHFRWLSGEVVHCILLTCILVMIRGAESVFFHGGRPQVCIGAEFVEFQYCDVITEQKTNEDDDSLLPRFRSLSLSKLGHLSVEALTPVLLESNLWSNIRRLVFHNIHVDTEITFLMTEIWPTSLNLEELVVRYDRRGGRSDSAEENELFRALLEDTGYYEDKYSNLSVVLEGKLSKFRKLRILDLQFPHLADKPLWTLGGSGSPVLAKLLEVALDLEILHLTRHRFPPGLNCMELRKLKAIFLKECDAKEVAQPGVRGLLSDLDHERGSRTLPALEVFEINGEKLWEKHSA